MISSFTIHDGETYKKFCSIARELHGHGGINKLIWDFIIKTVEKYEGSKSLDSFLNTNHVQEPSLKSDLEKSILPYMRSLSTEDLTTMMIKLYQAYTYAKELKKTHPEKRKTVQLNYMQIWRRENE